MRIINKYIAGLFKTIRTTEFRIRIAVATVFIVIGVYYIVIIYASGIF